MPTSQTTNSPTDSKQTTPGTGTLAKKNGNFTHRLYTGQFEFGFIQRRKTWYTISIVLVVISLAAVLLRGLNLGIEFQGGSVFTVPVSSVQDDTVEQMRTAAEDSGVDELRGTQVTTVGDSTIRVQTRSLSTEEVTQMRAALAAQAGTSADNVNYSLIGPSWGQQITMKALQALVVFLVLVGLLIWAFFREWRMSISALTALAHDLIITVGLYALIGFTVSPATLIGVLTILGYSLYDTVVVFDKVRENTKDITKQNRTFTQAANAAINQVLVRSINTTLIGVLPVLALLIAGLGFMGGEGPLADLGLALLIGMLTGAYSSIFIATPLLAQLREAQPEMKKHAANLAKKRQRAKAQIKVTQATVATSDLSPASVSDPQIDLDDDASATTPTESSSSDASTTAKPVRESSPQNSAGRNQPIRTTRSQRKK